MNFISRVKAFEGGSDDIQEKWQTQWISGGPKVGTNPPRTPPRVLGRVCANG